MSVSDLTLYVPQQRQSGSQPFKIGFIVRRSDVVTSGDVEAVPSMEETAPGAPGTVCLLDKKKDDDLFLNMESTDDWDQSSIVYVVEEGKNGVYNIFFSNCESNSLVSFKLHLQQYNVHDKGVKDYLPAGESNLPVVYLVCAILFFAAFMLWTYLIVNNWEAVHTIHLLMTFLLFLKVMTLVCEGLRHEYIKITGVSSGWSVAYYIFSFLKGVTLFSVILLIGTGWSFLKPFLSDKDKHILLVVLPLQIMVNVASVVLEETSIGSAGWLTWKDILRLFDIICCCAILFPIVWSIKHLREASETDGKAARNLNKLSQFRQFYIGVVSYVYFTRIVVFLLGASLPYKNLFMEDLIKELATLAFYIYTGFKFYPGSENPYLKVDRDDDEQTEMRSSPP